MLFKKKSFWFVVILLAVTGYYLIPRFFFGMPPMMGMGMPGGPVPVVAADVIEKEVILWDEFSGRLTAVDNVQLRPRVAGMVESVHFEDGQLVKKDDLLFIIDPRPYKAALSAAQAQYSLASAEFKRAEPLIAEQAISQRDFDQRKSRLAAASAQLTQAKLNMEYTHVKAPVAGKVGRREVTPGNLVDVGMPVLTTIVSQDPIYADFEADERRFLESIHAVGGDVKEAADIPVMLESSNNAIHEGRVQSFDNQINVASGTIRVRAVFKNPDGALVPGMFARIRMGIPAQQTAILISDQAVSTDQDKKFVYVISEDGKANYRQVTLGQSAGDLRVVRDGLKAGETIIVSGLHRIQMPGTPVQPTKIPMEDANNPAPPPQMPGGAPEATEPAKEAAE